MKRNITYGALIGFMVVDLIIFTAGCIKKYPHNGKVVFTKVPVKTVSDEQLKSNDFKYASGMSIAIVEMTKNPEDIEILTKAFASARAPEISYDRKSMIFSGQKEAGDIWQIWQMVLNNNELKQVTHSDHNCTDPVWLPDGRVAYSKQIEGDKGLRYHALFSCYSDGSDEQQITFQPHEDVNAGMLNDGRLLVNSKQVYPEVGAPKYLAIHPDGTKAELFYPAIVGAKSMSKAWESVNRKLVFVESGQLITIDFNRPLHSRKLIGNAGQGEFLSAFPVNNQHILVSVKKPTERTFGLQIVDLPEINKNNFYFNDASYHAVEPVIVMQRPVPKKLPSTVNLDKNSGTFVSMDADRSDIKIAHGVTSKIQVLGLDGIIGETAVEKDGSFYLEVGADQPVRFQTISAEGEVLRGPSSWMWVRPNEQRGCVGCHEDREMAPENTVPLAINNLPVSIK